MKLKTMYNFIQENSFNDFIRVSFIRASTHIRQHVALSCCGVMSGVLPSAPPTFLFRCLPLSLWAVLTVVLVSLSSCRPVLTRAFGARSSGKKPVVWVFFIWVVFSNVFLLNRICCKHRSGCSQKRVSLVIRV